MSEPKTMKVKPTSEEQGAYIIINEDDFDEAVHKKFTDAELAKIEKAEAKKADAADEEAEA